MLTAGGVAVDASGNLFITNSGTHQIFRMDHTTGSITVVAGNRGVGYTGDGGPATSATLNLPQGIAIDSSGNLFIARAVVAVARKLAVLLHWLWVSGEVYEPLRNSQKAMSTAA